MANTPKKRVAGIMPCNQMSMRMSWEMLYVIDLSGLFPGFGFWLPGPGQGCKWILYRYSDWQTP